MTQGGQGHALLVKGLQDLGEPQHLSSLQAELARKIMSLIAEGRWELGERLSDVALARELGTSRTPVRHVLQVLMQQGIVSQTPNRGFQLASRTLPDASLNGAIPFSDLESLYNELMMARASGVIGDEVSEAELVEQFGVTRGAVRRTLMRIAAEGLVERRPGHGWRFAEFLDNTEAVNESYAFRVIIECGAVLEPDYAPDMQQLAALQKEQQTLLDMPIVQMERKDWFEANANFHLSVVSWARNRFLIQSISRQNSLRRMTEYSEFTQLSETAVRKAARDHLGILDAISNGDNKFAAALLRRHLSRTGTGAHRDQVESGSSSS